MEKSTKYLKEDKLSENAVKKGDLFPDFNLVNINNKCVKISDFFLQRRVVPILQYGIKSSPKYTN